MSTETLKQIEKYIEHLRFVSEHGIIQETSEGYEYSVPLSMFKEMNCPLDEIWRLSYIYESLFFKPEVVFLREKSVSSVDIENNAPDEHGPNHIVYVFLTNKHLSFLVQEIEKSLIEIQDKGPIKIYADQELNTISLKTEPSDSERLELEPLEIKVTEIVTSNPGLKGKTLNKLIDSDRSKKIISEINAKVSKHFKTDYRLVINNRPGYSINKEVYSLVFKGPVDKS